MAYYFAALALGLIGGIAITPTWLGIALMAAIVAGIAIADHPRLAPRTEIHELLLDRAVVDSRAFLIGERFMTVDDPGAGLTQMIADATMALGARR